jgi:O-acetyl-ADP-ribose deacetylase
MSQVKVESFRGDITQQHGIDVIVNAANAMLRPGGGVAGAIHRAAGPGLHEDCKSLAPISPGEAVITAAHQLPNKFVAHCLGPVFGRDKPEAELLASCYVRALQLADGIGVKSIALPAISTGIFGYPTEEAARVAFQAIKSQLQSLKHITLIRMVLWAEDDFMVHKKVMDQVFNQ